jgi:hypothetical protein
MTSTDVPFQSTKGNTSSKEKKRTQKLASTSKPLETQVDDANIPAERTIEQIYQKKSQLEHILLRPDTYSKIAIPPFFSFLPRFQLDRSKS